MLDMGDILDIQLKRMVASQEQEAKNNEGQSPEFRCSGWGKSGGATVQGKTKVEEPTETHRRCTLAILKCPRGSHMERSSEELGALTCSSWVSKDKTGRVFRRSQLDRTG